VAVAPPSPDLPADAVRIAVADDLGRPRLTVLFRSLLALPHLVWLGLWTIPALLALPAAWAGALVTGVVPEPLHRFLGAYVRYATHVSAYVLLVGRRFPGFLGRAGSYGIDLELGPRRRQSRWTTLLRGPLAVPAFLLAIVVGVVAMLVAILAWSWGLVRGRIPEGVRTLGVLGLRYTAHTYAYLFLLTSRYPHLTPPEPTEEETP